MASFAVAARPAQPRTAHIHSEARPAFILARNSRLPYKAHSQSGTDSLRSVVEPGNSGQQMTRRLVKAGAGGKQPRPLQLGTGQQRVITLDQPTSDRAMGATMPCLRRLPDAG
jgi:hypothetical protein